jgi:hypothetical protein
MSWGKIEKIRIYNNVFRWRPSEDEFYITRKRIVKEILINFNREEMSKLDWNAYKDYTPENVMNIFKKVYIDN